VRRSVSLLAVLILVACGSSSQVAFSSVEVVETGRPQTLVSVGCIDPTSDGFELKLREEEDGRVIVVSLGSPLELPSSDCAEFVAFDGIYDVVVDSSTGDEWERCSAGSRSYCKK